MMGVVLSSYAVRGEKGLGRSIKKTMMGDNFGRIREEHMREAS